MWFKALTGFNEESPAQVQANLTIEGDAFVSKANGRKFAFGSLEIPTLGQLRAACSSISGYAGQIACREVVANVQTLHLQTENTNALFQAASQFNLLEMAHYGVTPEQGIDRYETDHTQGPACAIACGAGTIYRNYFVALDDQIGQTQQRQVDCLELIGEALGQPELNLWQMRNGYALAHQDGLQTIQAKISAMTAAERDALKALLKVGIQWDTEVTLSASGHRVSQVYCSALPVAYTPIEPGAWEGFAKLVLEASYEATLFAALRNMETFGCNVAYLTLLGGGVFGNETAWILDAITMALRKFSHVPLDIRFVSYGQSNPALRKCLQAI